MTRKTSAKAPKSSEKMDGNPMLPLPEAVIRHHGATLSGPMKAWLESRKLPPVLLLTGLPGVGKRSMAHYLGQWILCERTGLNARSPAEAELGLFGEAPAPEAAAPGPPSLSPCGDCPSCHKALDRNCIDFTEIRPESGESEDSPASSTLKIDQFRRLKASLGFGAHEGNHRIVLIAEADRMTAQAANSVLKLLEEPPPGWIFILTAADETLLLATLVSRCQRLRLKPFPEKTLEELIPGDPARRVVCARLAHGSWGRALAWSSDEAWQRRKGILDFLADPVAGLAPLVDWASQEPANLGQLIDQLESLTLDLVRWSVSDNASDPDRREWRNSDAAPVLRMRAREARAGLERARAQWLERASGLAEARQKLSIPLNKKLLAQNLLIPWLS